MSHEIDTSQGKAAFAFTGNRDAIWHGLGQELSVGAPIETWIEEAGMSWTVKEAESEYVALTPDGIHKNCKFKTKKTLYRSDDQEPLSIVGKDFKIVQPREVLEFFRDLTEMHGMVLSTAGCLFKGSRFWALAETGRCGQVVNGDTIKGHLLFITSVDGSLASMARFVSTRVVCNNTLTIALSEGGKNIVRKTHSGVWDSKQAKIDLGLLDKSWESFMENLNKLHQKKMSEAEVKEFFKASFFDPKKEENDQSWGVVKRVDSLMHLYENGAGADYAKGTAYGALNAVTNLYTHGTGKKTPDWKFWGAYIDSDAVKHKAMSDLLAMA